MPTYVSTLKNSTGSIQATIRYPMEEGAYPIKDKDLTKYKLANGNFAYDEPSNSVKRRWEFEVVREDSGDDLITKLNQLFDLKETLLLDEDALVQESGISVKFEKFQPTYHVGNWYTYQVVLQEQ